MRKKIAIDLTWVRHKKVGGTESCIRNLLNGFSQINTNDLLFILLVTKDNYYSFKLYSQFSCFEIYKCNVESSSQIKRVIWQNTKMGKLLKSLNINVCLEPVYGKPVFGVRKIEFITIIHDLQAKHYPQYFNILRITWMKFSWKNAIKSSKKIIAISEFVKKDILLSYKIPKDRVSVIYDAVLIDRTKCLDIRNLDKYGIKKNEYYYTVSSLFLHKNIKTVILAIAELKKRNSKLFFPLVVSGIGGKKKKALEELIYENGLQNDIIFTEFVSDSERNMLYKNCKVFLFSSIFEGFGMPPIEAMLLEVPVLTTKCTSLEEVTGGLVNYVDNPLDYIEWANRLESNLSIPTSESVNMLMKKYESDEIAEQYVKLLKEV